MSLFFLQHVKVFSIFKSPALHRTVNILRSAEQSVIVTFAQRTKISLVDQYYFVLSKLSECLKQSEYDYEWRLLKFYDTTDNRNTTALHYSIPRYTNPSDTKRLTDRIFVKFIPIVANLLSELFTLRNIFGLCFWRYFRGGKDFTSYSHPYLVLELFQHSIKVCHRWALLLFHYFDLHQIPIYLRLINYSQNFIPMGLPVIENCPITILTKFRN